MPNIEVHRNAITIIADHDKNTVNVSYNDLDQWGNMLTCVMGLGVLYNRCLEAGIPEAEVHRAMMSNLMTAIADFKTTDNQIQ